MRWILAGCCGLVLINLSVALNNAVQVSQKPRFYGVKTSRDVAIYCLSSKQQLPGTVQWYKADKYDVPPDERKQILENHRITFRDKDKIQNGILYLHNLQTSDSSVYFCKMNDTWGPGTELQAVKPIDRKQAGYRTKMKDGLMILQGLLLAVCIAAILLRNKTLLEKTDSIYEEPETDHIYEGLAVETCGGGLYEELTVYNQPEGTEAPWE